jgi:hypothetical protein
MDSLTVSGIYWLWPYGDEKVFGRSSFTKMEILLQAG